MAGIDASVGHVGDSCDNALAETIIGLCKTEVIHARGPWRTLDARGVEWGIGLQTDVLLKGGGTSHTSDKPWRT